MRHGRVVLASVTLLLLAGCRTTGPCLVLTEAKLLDDHYANGMLSWSFEVENEASASWPCAGQTAAGPIVAHAHLTAEPVVPDPYGGSISIAAGGGLVIADGEELAPGESKRMGLANVHTVADIDRTKYNYLVIDVFIYTDADVVSGLAINPRKSGRCYREFVTAVIPLP